VPTGLENAREPMTETQPSPWRTWAEAGLSLVYPDACQLCGVEPATLSGGYVGEACRREVRFVRPPFCRLCGRPYEGAVTHEFRCGNCAELDLQFHWARSAVLADGPVLEAIHRYKYNRHVWFENFLGELFVGEAAPALRASEWDCLLPVPLHPLKEREREFNQAERLARRLSERTGIPLAGRLLQRLKPTRTQTLLSRPERIENVRGAFALREKRPLRGWRCLLVDDVFTTGSTTSACARVLRSAGAELVAVWTLARGL
jgi:competence protein ComFC